MALEPGSREGSITSRRRRPSRNSSNTSADVFSDYYALDSPVAMGDITPVESIQNSIDITLGDRENASSDTTTAVPHSTIPTTLATLPQSSSTTDRTAPLDPTTTAHRATPSLALSDAGTTRSFSTSSRLSMPRPHSPYDGPTAPTQPYAMYPQVTRASSIASESTVRPSERPFVSQGGPEHPYAMYQNTVPEEEDDDESSPNVPLSFPAGSSLQGSRSSGNDTGDIVGTDGHVETLPPYTRYADNVVAKGDMADIDPPTAAVAETESAQTEPVSTPPVPEPSAIGAEAIQDAEARKEGWRARAKRRKCCGVPCWMVCCVFAVIFISAALGGIIGGIIGNKQGTKRAEAAASSSIAAIWLDTTPVPTDATTPPVPTGHYTMYLNQTEQVQQCILDPGFQAISVWDCMDVAALGVSVFYSEINQSFNAVFDDYSVRPQLFRYGPQPPDFNSSQFRLNPVKDKVDDEFGVAMFFSSFFDKIVIMEEDQIEPDGVEEKRSVRWPEVQRRAPTEFNFLAVGDSPWYCYWNQTIEEFWIFLEKESYSEGPSSTVAQGFSTVTSAPDSGSGSDDSSTSTPGDATSTPTPAKDAEDAFPTSAPTWDGPKRRDYHFPDASPTIGLPNLVKMVEKRKPHSNVQPYCQQMTVKPNWQIIPKDGVETIVIEETQYAPEPTGNERRWTGRFGKRDDDTVLELESMCICEWMTG